MSALKFLVPEKDTTFVNDVENFFAIAADSCYVISHGKIASRTAPLEPGCECRVVPRVLGGKGGFGSMLRAIGAQIEKTTSREACRDLSGRRIRDVNNEKNLKDWVSKQSDREREKEERAERRRAKRAKFLEEAPGKLQNPEYDREYAQMMSKSQKAIEEGLNKIKDSEAGAASSTSRKRKAESSSLDKYDRWSIEGGVDLQGIDSESSSDDDTSRPSSSTSSDQNVASTSYQCDSSTSDVAAASTSHHPTTQAKPPMPDSLSENPDSPSDAPRCKAAKLSEARCSGYEGAGSSWAAGGASGNESGKENGVHSTQKGSTEGQVSSTQESCTDPIDLSEYSCAEDLESLGLERLKADLTRRGLKCGGSVQERAFRLFSVKGVPPEDIPIKLLAKGKGQGKSSQKQAPRSTQSLSIR